MIQFYKMYPIKATGEFPDQRASNAENVYIWWRHHAWLYFMNASKLTSHIEDPFYKHELT